MEGDGNRLPALEWVNPIPSALPRALPYVGWVKKDSRKKVKFANDVEMIMLFPFSQACLIIFTR